MLSLLDFTLLLGICFVGAATPGISLAVVARHTLIGGSRAGVACSVAHAFGVGLWALATVTGLALLFQRYPELNQAFHIIGGLFLLWMAWRSWQASKNALPPPEENEHSQNLHQGAFYGAARDGFMIAFLNPKVGLFYLAIFSQLLNNNLSVTGKAQMVITAGFVDGGWYAFLAIMLARNASLVAWLKSHHHWLDRAMAVLMLVIALSVLSGF